LRFKNNFAGVPDRELPAKEFGNTMRNPEAAVKNGSLGCRVWILGTKHPIVYHVKCSITSFFMSQALAEDEWLGFAGPTSIKDEIKDSLNRGVETLAIKFFKARKEM
jgi:hypothetical protein